ncbi:MAG: hypothetical protein FJX80_02790 [Bacteroidetes bacterium]|nr:hypothetical protein [Bacteroidota bacterium]
MAVYKDHDDFWLVLIGLALFFVFNPLYVLLFLVIVERWTLLPKEVNYIFAFSFSLLFINREIGNSWTSGDAFAADDALNYLEYYRNVFDLDFLRGLGLTLIGGGEPLWFLLAGLVNILSNGNEFAILVVSVAVPVFLLQRVFYSISRDFLFNTAFFIIFFPEINHVLYHLWRYSLSLVLVLTVFVVYLSTFRINGKYYFTSILAHISSSFTLSFILFTRFFRSNVVLSLGEKLKFIFIFFSSLIILSSLVYTLIEFIEYEKAIFYLKSNEIVLPFAFNGRHFFYLLLASGILTYTRLRVSFLVSLLGVFSLAVPFFYEVSLAYERFLLLITPIVIIVFLFEIKNLTKFKSFLLLPMILVAFSFWWKIDGKLFYAFMSNGHAFHVFNGVGLNFYDLLSK